MKLQIEVPDGFIAGKLVFITETNDGVNLDSLDVKTGRVLRVEKLSVEKSKMKQRVAWEAD